MRSQSIPATYWPVVVILGVFSATSSVAHCQSFNIDLGLDTGPSVSYAAAGMSGHWMSVPGTQGVNVTGLVDVDGNTTSARFTQIGGTETLSFSDPTVDGDDANLMNDALITHSAVENCMFFSDVLPGRYAVLIYAWMPDEPSIVAVTNVDQELGNPHLMVGGVWPGDHVEGVSYSRHIAHVAATGAQAGRLGLHSGVPSGGDYTIGAALNGVQVVRLADADFDASGTIDGADVDLLVAEIAAGTDGAAFDLTGDEMVDQTDLSRWLSDAGAANQPSGESYQIGDANLDGVVDGQDFIAWSSHKFSANAAWTFGDFNADGNVDSRDFLLWNASKSQVTNGVAVPESKSWPAAVWVLLVGMRLRRS